MQVSSLIKRLRIPKGVTLERPLGWYNHATERPVGYHFLSAITAKNLKRLNGFDERYANRKSFDDDELLTRIKRMGLSVVIPNESTVMAVHQFHIRQKSVMKSANNELLFFNKTLKESGYYSQYDELSNTFLEKLNVESDNS
jgi:hypothetical protein